MSKNIKQLIQLGLKNGQNGYVDQAIANFEEVLEQDSQNVAAILLLAQALEHEQQLHKAHQRYLEATSLCPSNLHVLKRLNRFCLKHSNHLKTQRPKILVISQSLYDQNYLRYFRNFAETVYVQSSMQPNPPKSIEHIWINAEQYHLEDLLELMPQNWRPHIIVSAPLETSFSLLGIAETKRTSIGIVHNPYGYLQKLRLDLSTYDTLLCSSQKHKDLLQHMGAERVLCSSLWGRDVALLSQKNKHIQTNKQQPILCIGPKNQGALSRSNDQFLCEIRKWQKAKHNVYVADSLSEDQAADLLKQCRIAVVLPALGEDSTIPSWVFAAIERNVLLIAPDTHHGLKELFEHEKQVIFCKAHQLCEQLKLYLANPKHVWQITEQAKKALKTIGYTHKLLRTSIVKALQGQSSQSKRLKKASKQDQLSSLFLSTEGQTQKHTQGQWQILEQMLLVAQSQPSAEIFNNIAVIKFNLAHKGDALSPGYLKQITGLLQKSLNYHQSYFKALYHQWLCALQQEQSSEAQLQDMFEQMLGRLQELSCDDDLLDSGLLIIEPEDHSIQGDLLSQFPEAQSEEHRMAHKEFMRYKVHKVFGQYYQKHNQALKAQNHFEQCLKHYSQDAYIHLCLARLAHQKNTLDQAQKHIKQALSIAPLSSEALGFKHFLENPKHLEAWQELSSSAT